ncbi:hypothetical protein MTR67_021513 [Solanum verrucosum]|uniref:Uncharacterized protein n=1 Tax=Solanum verrucosum TaxID=315347 RepID=A0AAF0QTL9_SOLVR|nr:hypothetical protein MTR67_021513 [Solanum verrucosum]
MAINLKKNRIHHVVPSTLSILRY